LQGLVNIGGEAPRLHVSILAELAGDKGEPGRGRVSFGVPQSGDAESAECFLMKRD